MNKEKFKLITFNKKQKANFAYKKKIIITDLLLNIIIGYHSFEKINKQNRFNNNYAPLQRQIYNYE